MAGWGLLLPAGPLLLADEHTYEVLPEAPGREDVYYTCSACHSINLVRQQRLSRDAWDDLLDWMVKEQGMPEPDPEEREILLGYLSEAYGVKEGAPVQRVARVGDPEAMLAAMPDHPGKEEVFYTCSACHSINLVEQQRLSRRSWDEVLEWMVEEQGMDELEPDERELILSYLSTAFGQDVPR